jgi:thymidine kinase
MGKIEVFTGPMCSGKSAALLNKIKRFEIAGKKICLFKPKKDTRDGLSIKSRNGNIYQDSKNIFQIESLSEMIGIIKLFEKIDLIAIDEFHFFKDDFEDFIKFLIELSYNEISVAISGLDMSHNGRPFELLGKVMCVADKVHKFTAICSFEKEDIATMTLMKIKTDDDKVVGGDDVYQPVSRKIWYESYFK